jgi:hypothetical protein
MRIGVVTRLFQVAQFGVLNFAIDLRHGLLAAHGQNGVTQPNQDADQSDRVRQAGCAQPTKSILRESEICSPRQWREVSPLHAERIDAPADHQDDHDCGHILDAQGFLTGLRDAFGVLPPEVNRDQRRKERSGEIHGKGETSVSVE